MHHLVIIIDYNCQNIFRPFHDAETSAVEIVVKTYLDGLLQLVDPVEVEVVHLLSVSAHIFVDDCERRRTYRVGHAQYLADSCRECGLSGTHGCKECHQSVVSDLFEKFGRSPFEVLDPADCHFVLHAAKICINVQIKKSGQTSMPVRLIWFRF